MALVGGGRRHLKRIAAPSSWFIRRKRRFGRWITKPSPGPHSIDSSLPLRVIVRDYLQLVENAREADKVIKRGEILVDNRVVKDPKFPVGLFDTLTIPKINKSYRVILDPKGRLQLKEISEEERDYKLVRVEKKTAAPGGFIQISTHDGRTFLFKETDLKHGDVMKIKLPSQEVEETYKLEKGNLVYILSGRHAGTVGTVEEVEEGDMLRPKLVKVSVEDTTIETAVKNVFVVGRNAPAITL